MELILTAEQLLAAMKAFVKANPTNGRADPLEEPTEEQMLWFVALRQAEEMQEGFSRKDLAQSLLAGIPKLTTAGIAEWLELQSEYIEEGGEAYDFNSMFTDFYGVR